ncbi:DUF1077-domain-containing protein [Ceraceosorus guamensis]|uniref:ER membrane protein complex subunit 4 n=1 Tax=Ceraceosorus guamensis TaxID=1522189 RepID=A0A316W9Y2_9BASI|nr:DUF1077-domain-containing protein [Ceraceosorus guamensis]PWN44813.1 DUF1077-domain-containing protein [Ceraceosorus guamensis]
MSLASVSVDLTSLAPQLIAGASSKSLVKSQGSSAGAISAVEPPGFVTPSSQGSGKSKQIKPRAPPSPESLVALKSKKAWDVALSPAKSLPMNAFMLYMSGSGVQIFSMTVVGMLLTSPIKGAMTIGQAFAPLSSPASQGIKGAPEEQSLLLQKVVFILAQALCFSLGVWKCASMGLLPTQSSDWLAWRESRTPLEFSPMYA